MEPSFPSTFAEKSKMNFRKATIDDLDLLAEWNYQLIVDEGHRNPMNIAELKVLLSENFRNS